MSDILPSHPFLSPEEEASSYLTYIDMSYVHLRITLFEEPPYEDTLLRLKSFIDTHYPKSHYITVIEEADEEVKRTHTHTLIQTNESFKAKQFKAKQFFKHLDGGNGAFATCTVKEPHKFLKYVCKGHKDVAPNVVFSSIPPDVVAQFHQQFYQKDDKSGCRRKLPRAQATTWTVMTFMEITSELPYIEVIDKDAIDKITLITLRCYGKVAKDLPYAKISSTVMGFANALLLRSPNAKAHTEFAKSVSDKIWRDNPMLI